MDASNGSKVESREEAMKVTVVIPNFNGSKFLQPCLDSLANQSMKEFEVIVIDNGSKDNSLTILKQYAFVRTICFSENQGFCKAVNRGIKEAKTKYVILLNNDTQAEPEFVAELLAEIEQNPRIFSVSAQMLQLNSRELIDDAGDFYTALGWAFARGKGKPAQKYDKPTEIFASCAGAAIYRKAIFEQIGDFDSNHFAYLEDIDIGYRARIYGYINRYQPAAKVLHAGSGFSGSKYNEFKVNFSSANSVYIIGKNMPLLQWMLNLPLLLTGFAIKILFFILKGMGITYIKGLWKGLQMCFSEEGKAHKVKFRTSHLGNYIKIQIELWWNIILRLIS